VVLIALAEMHNRIPRGESSSPPMKALAAHSSRVLPNSNASTPVWELGSSGWSTTKSWRPLSRTPCDFGVFPCRMNDKRLTVVPIPPMNSWVITPPVIPWPQREKATVAEVVEYPLLLPKSGRTREPWKKLFHERRF